MNKEGLIQHISNRLIEEKEHLQLQFESSKNTPFAPHCLLDNLLPQEICQDIYEHFPPLSEMKFASNFREQKHVTRSSEQIRGVLADITFAFQDQGILDLVTQITGEKELLPDSSLYGSGLSSMTPGDYLNPHIDNSHDQLKENKRVLNVLYYVSPEWISENGGNLELWDKKVKTKKEISAKFNRVVFMATNKTSFHAVNQVVKGARRNCVSNYYFAKSLDTDFHISIFKARPGHTLDAIKFGIDTTLRKGIRLFFKRGVFIPDTYQKGTHPSKGLKETIGSIIRDSLLYRDRK